MKKLTLLTVMMTVVVGMMLVGSVGDVWAESEYQKCKDVFQLGVGFRKISRVMHICSSFSFPPSYKTWYEQIEKMALFLLNGFSEMDLTKEARCPEEINFLKGQLFLPSTIRNYDETILNEMKKAGNINKYCYDWSLIIPKEHRDKAFQYMK